jgi:hypothetical protein
MVWLGLAGGLATSWKGRFENFGLTGLCKDGLRLTNSKDVFGLGWVKKK